jgi:SSS family solute:Na+ symporter
MVGYSLVSGSTLGRDIVGRALGVADGKRAAMLSRLGILVSCLAAVVLALQFQSVVAIWYRWSGVLIGPLLIPTLLGYLSHRPGRQRALVVSISMLSGFIISLGWLLYGSRIVEGQATGVLKGVSFDDIGTLLPGAVASAVAYAIGTLAVGRSTR